VNDVAAAVRTILDCRARVAPERALLVGVSGIDGSGKGYVTEQIVSRLRGRDVRAVGINADGWLDLPSRRFDPCLPAEHFYENGLRLDEMFRQLVLPLRDWRSLRLVADLADATGREEYRQHTYEYEDVDVIVLEGIFLLKERYRRHYDLSFWVDCTFETALERALRRGQEGLPPEETARDYRTTYFPAQRLHIERDGPRAAATAVIVNDGRISHPAV
jgi:uridine kinase